MPPTTNTNTTDNTTNTTNTATTTSSGSAPTAAAPLASDAPYPGFEHGPGLTSRVGMAPAQPPQRPRGASPAAAPDHCLPFRGNHQVPLPGPFRPLSLPTSPWGLATRQLLWRWRLFGCLQACVTRWGGFPCVLWACVAWVPA